MHRTSGEKKIGFLEADYEKLAEEVKSIDEKYNARPPEKIDLVPQRTGNPHKAAMENMIPFLDNEVPAPDKKASPETDAESQRPHRFDQSSGHQNAMSQASSIGRINDGNVSHYGETKREMGVGLGNSIWDSGQLQRLAEQPTSKEQVEDSKRKIEDRRAEAKVKEQNEISEIEASTDVRNPSSIAPASPALGKESRRTGPSQISVFDVLAGNMDFNEVPEKTEGELAVDARREQRGKKDRMASGPVTTKGMTSQLFDGLVGQEDK